MDNQDSDDYELVSKQEVDSLRQEIHSLKKNSLAEGEMGRVLLESIDRLALSINRMITILDDAQKDIIDEYQQSKPAEKLNKLLEQNQMIAKALVAISENFNSQNSKDVISPSNNSQNFQSIPSQAMDTGPRSMVFTPSLGGQSVDQAMQQSRQFSTQNNNSFGGMGMSSSPMMNPSSMGPMDDLPPMDSVPPLDVPPPGVPKKKFLGIM